MKLVSALNIQLQEMERSGCKRTLGSMGSKKSYNRKLHSRVISQNLHYGHYHWAMKYPRKIGFFTRKASFPQTPLCQLPYHIPEKSEINATK